MLLAISRFKVANGIEEQVRKAFLNRPHLVDTAPGFLGMETFTLHDDPAIFYLVTRWTNADHYKTWHSSPAHHASHKWIPKGLKLDPEFTQVTLMERLSSPSHPIGLQELTADAAPLLAASLATTCITHLWLVARDGTVQLVNAAAAAQLRSLPEQIVGTSFWAHLTDADAENLRARIADAERKPGENLLLNFVDARQSPFTLECHLDLHPVGFILVGEPPRRQDEAFQETTLGLNNELATLTRENARKSRELERSLGALKAAQSMLVHQEKMASLGRMTAGVAHEINNPVAFVTNNHSTLRRDFQDLIDFTEAVKTLLPELASAAPAAHERIAGMIEALDLDYLGRTIRKKLADNLDGLERVKRIVLDLRTFSRLDEDDFKPCDLAEGIASTLRFLSPLLEEHDVKLETNFATLPPLNCSPGHLNQAISNVVANAIQASRSGQTVRISTLARDGHCVIQVTDAGVGIASENLARVFDPFFTTKPVGSGTGLGLHIAHQVITAHHGEIKIGSELGHGTTVEMKVPFNPPVEEPGCFK
jgi:signal transduction histidine kinase/heme-degrading monooxygenase HmoA